MWRWKPAANLRLDQFLSESRIIKRRTQAKLACDNQIVSVDGLVAKPSKEVKVGQKIRIEFIYRTLEFEVLEIPRGSVRKDLARNLYRILKEEKKTVELD